MKVFNCNFSQNNIITNWKFFLFKFSNYLSFISLPYPQSPSYHLTHRFSPFIPLATSLLYLFIPLNTFLSSTLSYHWPHFSFTFSYHSTHPFSSLHSFQTNPLGALCYVELGCLIPSSGAEHTYFLTAFGHLPSFLFAWVSIVVLKPSMLAIVCLSFSEYFVEAFAEDCEPPKIAIQMLGALTIGERKRGPTWRMWV